MSPQNKMLHRDSAISPPSGDARKVATSGRPTFEGCTFGFELLSVSHISTGQMKIVILVPYEGKSEALKLTDTPGLLLEASVTPFEASKA
jgi:hypothetical protein